MKKEISLDCTLRDGGYYITDFSLDLKDYIKSISSSE